MSRHFRHLFTASLAALAFGVATAGAKEDHPRHRLTFFCADFPVITRYRADNDGVVVDVIPPRFGEVPPNQLYLPGDPKPVRVPWSSGRLSREILWDAAKSEVLTISVETPAAANNRPNSKQGKPENTSGRLTIATVNLPKPDRPQLIALYQPDLSGKWLPVKTLTLDISPENIPPGACAVLNLSNLPAHVLLGEQGAPAAVAPGDAKVIPAPLRTPEATVLTRVAVLTPDGAKILANSRRPMPGTSRHLLIIGSTRPSMGGGLPAYVNIKPLE